MDVPRFPGFVAELGLGRIDLQYQQKDKTDQFGNVFRYRARVWDLRGSQGNRWSWDVFLARDTD